MVFFDVSATPAAKKALTIGIALIMLNQLCGCFAMLNYTASIFSESGSNLTPNMAAIVVGLIQLLGACFSTMLVDRAGRKVLLKRFCFNANQTCNKYGSCSFFWHFRQSEQAAVWFRLVLTLPSKIMVLTWKDLLGFQWQAFHLHCLLHPGVF